MQTPEKKDIGTGEEGPLPKRERQAISDLRNQSIRLGFPAGMKSAGNIEQEIGFRMVLVHIEHQSSPVSTSLQSGPEFLKLAWNSRGDQSALVSLEILHFPIWSELFASLALVGLHCSGAVCPHPTLDPSPNMLPCQWQLQIPGQFPQEPELTVEVHSANRIIGL